MGDFFCIYSGREWPESERSREHIIPYALGGSADFVTYDVAKTPNNEVGSSADGSLINNWYVSTERWRLGLKSENGNIPPLEFDGTVDFEGRQIPMRYVIKPDGTATLKPVPEVHTDWETGKASLFCDVGDAEKILGSIDKRAKEKGFVDKKMGDPTITKLEKPPLKTELVVRRDQLGPGFLKIALATGHVILGYEWSTGKDADAIRKCMQVATLAAWKEFDVRGTFWPNWECPFRNQLRLDEDRHVILVNNQNPIGVYCLLFGKYDGIVTLHKGIWKGPGISPGEGIVFVVDCRSRSARRYTFEEFVEKKKNGELFSPGISGQETLDR